MKLYRVVGIMSGTSLDGVDLALCSFSKDKDKWNFAVDAAETLAYNDQWQETLRALHSKNAETFALTHIRYGRFLGLLVKDFLIKNKTEADFVASHGHTIFHQPSRHFTFQIGDGASISVASGLPVVSDFRTVDVALGGQGAPLVPAGDLLLFDQYDSCLNLGGIANISLSSTLSPLNNRKECVVAFDICPCNIVLNWLAKKSGSNYDENGRMALSGKINLQLLHQLNDLEFYRLKLPKSLGREGIEKDFFTVIDSSGLSTEDKLCTFCEHIAWQISLVSNLSTLNNDRRKLLITGGGVYNGYLIERIRHYCKDEIEVPDKTMIEFKEAIIFAFLGVLRWTGEVNCLKSVTGAEKDSSGGAIYHPAVSKS